MPTVHVFDFLETPSDAPLAPVCVLFGDEPFLRGLARKQVRQRVAAGGEVLEETFEGERAEWRDVADELSTLSLFGGTSRRLVLVQDADKFVSNYRSQLEAYVERPKATGILVLDVSTWASNTKLYKAVDKTGLQIECRAPSKPGKRANPDESRIAQWLASWSHDRHDARLPLDAARALLDLVGPTFGILDQELAKLALFAGRGGQITAALVRDVVGGWRAKTIWDLTDAALDGNAAAALEQLDRMSRSGEHPLAMFGAMAAALRRFPTAARIYERAEKQGRPVTLREALLQAGVPQWPAALEKAERQIKQLGRHRAIALYRWLLETDLALKGTHSAPHRARFALEKLILRLSRAAAQRL